MDQLEDEDDVRDLSSDDEDQDQQVHLAEMEDDDDDEGDDNEKVNDLDFIAQHAAEPFVFSSDVSKAVIATTGSLSNDEEVEMNQSDDESEQEVDPVVMSDNDTSSDDESDILEMERKTATKDTYTSHKTEAASWLTEEEENMPSGPPRTRNEVDENYDVFDPNEFDLAGTRSTHEASSSSSGMADNKSGNLRSVATQDLVQIGKVLYRMDNECLVVVEANYTMSPLNEGSILCAESGLVLGKICEVFGPITNPFYVMRWGSAQTSSSSGASASRGNGRNGDKGSKSKRQGKGKGEGNETLMQLDNEEGVKEEVKGDKEKQVASEGNGMNKAATGEQEGREEDAAGVIEMKESTDGGDGVNVDDGINEETTTTTAVSADIKATLGPTLAPDTHAVTNQSFFATVIVTSCQPGSVVCSASQHRYVYIYSCLRTYIHEHV